MPDSLSKILSVGHIQPQHDWHMAAHRHDFHELIVLTAGSMRARIGDAEERAAAGDVLFYPRGVAHEEATDPADPAETLFICFECAALDAPGAIPLRRHDVHGRLRLLASWLYADRTQLSPAVQSVSAAYMNAMVAELQRDTSPEEIQLVSAVHQFIHARLDTPLTLEDLARHVGMSKFYFLRRFKELTGRTPMQDLRTIRLDRARELLLTTNLPVKSIATRVGLANEYHLSRMFRRHFDLTPGNLRKWIKP